MTADNGSHATLSDVYQLVDRTRQEAVDQINALGTKLETYANATERRLTTVEVRQDAHDKQFIMVVNRLDQHGKEIDLVKNAQQSEQAASAALANAKTQRWSTREKVLGAVTATVAAASGMALALHALG